jgi:hypothetical protein
VTAFLNGLSNRFMLFSVSSKWDELAAIFGCFCTEQYFTAWRKCHILMTQAWLPLNPDHIPNMNWDLALHHHFISDQYQPAALFRAVSTVLSIANDCDCGIAIFVANYGACLIGRYVKSIIFTISTTEIKTNGID